MNDNLQPLSDDQLEARITAYVLGEASPFEAEEIRSMIQKSPELKLFYDRLRTLDSLVKDAETTSNSADEKWKLPAAKRSTLEPMLGSSNQGGNIREFRIRRAAFRSAIGIAAVFLVTLFLSKFFRFTNAVKESAMVETYSAKSEKMAPQAAAIQREERAEEHDEILSAISRTKLSKDLSDELVDRIDDMKLQLADGQAVAEPESDLAAAEPSANSGEKNASVTGRGGSAPVAELEGLASKHPEKKVHIGGQVNQPGAVDFKEGLTLYDAVQSAGGATPFGSEKRVKLNRAGKTETYDLTDKRLAEIELKPDDAIEMPQKTLFGCGGGRDEVTKFQAEAEKTELAPPVPTVEADPTSFDAIPMAAESPARKEAEVADARYGGDQGETEGFRSRQQAGDSMPAPTAEPKAEPSQPEDDLRNAPQLKKSLDASVARAQEMRKVGKYDEARELLKQAEATAPNDPRVQEELGYLEAPLRVSPALTFEHQRNIDEVRRKLYEAQGNYDLGKFDKAKEVYEDTLRIDPYNKAARRGMERVEAAKSDYYRAAYDQTRAELLMQADKAWELEVPAEKEAELKEGENISGPLVDGVQPEQKMDPIRAELLKEVDRAWELAAPSDKEAQSKEGKDVSGFLLDADQPEQNERLVDSFADSLPSDKQNSKQQLFFESDGFANNGAPTETESLTGLFSKGENSRRNDSRFDTYNGFSYEMNSGATKTDSSLFNTGFESDFSDSNSDRFTWDQSQAGQLSLVPGTPAAPAAGSEVTKRSGAKANIEVIREFIYPTEFEPGEPPNVRGLDLGGEGQQDLGLLSESAIDDSTPLIDRGPMLGDLPVVGKLQEQPKIDLADLSQEIPASQEPFSTFSLNVSDASFQIAAAAIENGESPDPESIKPEQFYNGVDYGDPAPSYTEPVAAAIDQTAHPVIPGRNLVRVGIRTASTGRSAAQPLRLTLMVDQSGSMVRDDRRAAMKTALEQLATLLNENDEVTVIGFSRTPRLLADSLKGDKAETLPDLINQTANEGGTNIEQAMTLASDLALRHKLEGAQNRIVLFTDGAANLGNANPDILAEKIKELRQQDLSFDIAGIGTNDLNDGLLSELARHGNGRYYLVGENTGASLATQLAGAFRPAAENVKVQVKLNPERVDSYKLIGFEKDRLKTEDFRNDSVDAAELAADEAGVAMYQVETLPEGSGEIGEVSVRFRDTASGEMIERTWTIPYDPTAPAFDKAPPKTQLATLSLLAAQKLQGGPLADAINFKNFAKTIAELRDTYESDQKAQRMLNLVNALK